MPELPSIIQRIFVEVTGAEAAQRKLKGTLDDVDSSVKKLDKDLGGVQQQLAGMGDGGKLGDLGKEAKATQQSFEGMGKAADDAAKKNNVFGNSADDAAKKLYAHNDAIKAGVAAHDVWGKSLERSTKQADQNNIALKAMGLSTDAVTPKVLGMSSAHRELEQSELKVFESHTRLTAARTKLRQVTENATSSEKDHVSAISDVRKAELTLVDALDGHRKKVTEVNNEQKKTGEGMNIIQKGLAALTGGTKSASEGFGGLISTLSILKGPGIIVGINLIASGLSALVGSAFSLISALGPLTGLLGALPGAAIGLGSAFATVKLAFGDVSKAMKAHDAQEKSTASTTKATAQAAQAAAERVREATRSRDKAIESSADTITNAEERVQEAEQGVVEAVRDAARAITQANKDVASAQEGIGEAAERAAEMVANANRDVENAEERVIRAQEDAQRTQEDLTRARQDAAEALQQLAFQARGDALSEESAQIRLIEAQQSYDKVMKSRASTDLDKRKAALDLKQAQLGVAEAQDRNADTQAKLTEEQTKGVEGSDQVQAALENQKQAAKGVVDANRALADAEKDRAKTVKDAAKLQADAQDKYGEALDNLAKTQIDANDKVAKANKNVEDSEKALAKARRDGADSVAEAERELTQAIAAQKDQMTGAGGAADTYKEALAKLTPEARAFVTQMEATQKQFEAVKAGAAAGLLPGLTTALKEVTPFFPTLTGVLKDTGQALGDVAIQAAKLIASREFSSGIAEVAKTNAQAFRDLGGEVGPEGKASSGLVGLIDAFRHVAVEAQPLIKWIGELGRQFGLYIDKIVITNQQNGDMARFFERAKETAITFGHIIRDLVAGIMNIGHAASDSGGKMLTSFETALAKFREWTGSLAGQNKLVAFFDSSREAMGAFTHLLGDLAKGFGAIADPGSLTPLIDAIDKQLLPPLMTILNSMKGSDFGPQLINLLEQILKLAGQFAGASGPLTTYLTTLTELTKIINWLVEHIPGMKEIFFILTTGFAANKALDVFLGPFGKLGTLARANTGLLGGFSNAMKGLPGTAGEAVGPMAKLGEKIGGLATKFGSATLDMLGNMGLIKRGAKEVVEEVAKVGMGEAISGGVGGAVGGAAAKKGAGAVEGAAGAGIFGAVKKGGGKLLGMFGLGGGAAAEGAAGAEGAGALGAAGISTGGIAIIVAAIAAGLVILYKNFKPFRDLIDATWQAIQKLWDIILGFLGATVSNIAQWTRNVGNLLSAMWDGITSGAAAVAGFFVTIWDGIVAGVVALKDAVVGAWNAIWAGVAAVWESVGKPIFDAIGVVINIAVGIFKLQFGLIVAIVKDAFEVIGHLWDVLHGVFDVIAGVVGWLAEQVFGFFFGMISDAVESSFHLIGMAWDVLHGVFDAIAGVVGWLHDTIFRPIFDKISGSVDISFKAIGAVWDWLRTNVFDRIASAADTLRGLVATAFETMGSAIGTAFSGIQTAWDNTAGRAISGMRTMFEWVRDNAGKIWSGLASGISGAFSGIVGVVRGAIGPVANVIGTLANAVGGILSAVGLNNVGDFLKGVGSDLKGFAVGRATGGTVPAAAKGGKGPYDDAPMVEVGPGFVTSGVRAIVGEGNQAYPEYVIPTDPRYRKRAVGLFAQLGRELELMARGGRVPAAALGLSSIPGAGLVKNAVGGIGAALSGAFDWTKNLATGAWKTGTGLLRRGSAWALEHAWPAFDANPTGLPLINAIPRGFNGARTGVLNWISGREDANSQPIAAPPMARGGRMPLRAAGGLVGRGSGGGRGFVRGYQVGGLLDPVGSSGTSSTSDLGLKVAIRAAFDAMASVVGTGLQAVSDGLSILHVDLVGTTEAVQGVTGPITNKLNDDYNNLTAWLTTNLTNFFSYVTTGLTTLQTELGTKVDAVTLKLVEVFLPLQTTVDATKVALDTLNTFTTEGLLPALTGEGGIKAEITRLVQPLADITAKLGEVQTAVGSVQSAVSNIQINAGSGGMTPSIGGGGGGVGIAPSAAVTPPPPTPAAPSGAPAPKTLATGAGVDAITTQHDAAALGLSVGAADTQIALWKIAPSWATSFKIDPTGTNPLKGASVPVLPVDPWGTPDPLAPGHQHGLPAPGGFAKANRGEVAAIQRILNDMGARPLLKVDGLWGPATQSAYDRIVKLPGAIGGLYSFGVDIAGAPSTGREFGRFASGGMLRPVGVGSGFVTARPQAIVGDGDPAFPEYVIPTDPKHRRRARSLLSSLASDLGVTTLAGGGVRGVSGVARAAGNLAFDAMESSREMNAELRRQTMALEELVKLARDGAGQTKGGVTFESGAFQVQAEQREVADSLARKMQVLAAVGAFGGAPGEMGR